MAKTIMVIHKNWDTRGAIKTLLEANAYEVIEVTSFEDYSAKVNKNIDLILIDALRSRKNVLEVAKKYNLKVAYFFSDEISEEELALYGNVVGSIDEPRDIKKFLLEVKALL
jgi:DNA-binding response OmpR family regulator